VSFPKSPHELAMRQTAALLLRAGIPMTPEAISAQTGAALADVRAALYALTEDGQVVQMGRLYSWPRRAA